MIDRRMPENYLDLLYLSIFLFWNMSWWCHTQIFKGSQIPMATSNSLEVTGICDPLNSRAWYYQFTELVQSLNIIVLFFYWSGYHVKLFWNQYPDEGDTKYLIYNRKTSEFLLVALMVSNSSFKNMI